MVREIPVLGHLYGKLEEPPAAEGGTGEPGKAAVTLHVKVIQQLLHRFYFIQHFFLKRLLLGS